MTPKLYEGTKRLLAQPMTRGAYNQYRGWDTPADENPADPGYLVEYQDGGKANSPSHAGYISWSPADVFERSYKEVPSTVRLNFGDAIQLLNEGARLARTGWNGRGMFIYLVPAASYPVQTGAAKAHFGAGAMVPYNAYLAIKNVDETVSTWAPSVSDCLAEDWVIVGEVGAAIESKTYPDGTVATGPGPLPEASPAEPSIEAEIQAKGLTAPRVTPDDLRANIVHTEIVKHVSPSGQVLRWAVLTTRNGFAVTGRPSASASSENDNEEVGKKRAIENAMQELWPLMGYALREKLAAGAEV